MSSYKVLEETKTMLTNNTNAPLITRLTDLKAELDRQLQAIEETKSELKCIAELQASIFDDVLRTNSRYVREHFKWHELYPARSLSHSVRLEFVESADGVKVIMMPNYYYDDKKTIMTIHNLMLNNDAEGFRQYVINEVKAFKAERNKND